MVAVAVNHAAGLGLVYLTSNCTACLDCGENAKAASLVQCCILSEPTWRAQRAANNTLMRLEESRENAKAANCSQSNNALISRRDVRAIKGQAAACLRSLKNRVIVCRRGLW